MAFQIGDKMNYTKGEWKVWSPYFMGDDIEIQVNGATIAMVKSGKSTVSQLITLANANLIAAAVNACASVNSENPQAVAESIKEMYEALRSILWDLNQRAMPDKQEVEKALAKAEGRK